MNLFLKEIAHSKHIAQATYGVVSTPHLNPSAYKKDTHIFSSTCKYTMEIRNKIIFSCCIKF